MLSKGTVSETHAFTEIHLISAGVPQCW